MGPDIDDRCVFLEDLLSFLMEFPIEFSIVVT